MIKVSLFYKTYDFYDIDCDENEDEFDDEDDIIELDKDMVELDVDIEGVDLDFLTNGALDYESSNVCKDILLTTKCETCKDTLESYCPLTQHGVIKQLEFTPDSENRMFTYPTLAFMSNFKLLFKKVEILLPFICHESFISRKLMSSLGVQNILHTSLKKLRKPLLN